MDMHDDAVLQGPFVFPARPDSRDILAAESNRRDDGPRPNSVIAARAMAAPDPRLTGPGPQAEGEMQSETPLRIASLPPNVRQAFLRGGAAWKEAISRAIAAGIVDPKQLADLLFFMQHPQRMSSGTGVQIDPLERDAHKLRVEWEHGFTIVARMLRPGLRTTVFLPERKSGNYEDFIAAPTTGRATLMVHGRNADGTGRVDPRQPDVSAGGFKDELQMLDRLQESVEALVSGDSLYIANWQFNPTALPLTTGPAAGSRSWGDLLAERAAAGVRIRVLIAQHPMFSPFMSPIAALDALIATLPTLQRRNLKYVVSAHAHAWGVHHQKFVVVKTSRRTLAFCGGLDLSQARAPAGGRWNLTFVWHDVGVRLEGLIAHDLEREFVERWNREKDRSTLAPLAVWKGLEALAQEPPSAVDRSAALNRHALQLHRTISVGTDPSNIRRDDIWRGYFRLIGRATRFIYLEDQYFHEPRLADAIVRQAEAQPGLIVIVMAGTGTDDRQAVDASATGLELFKQTVMVDHTKNAFALRHEFFERLSVPPLGPDRLRVYTLNYAGGILHSKLILVDDEALSIGSANANPRGFFFDSELNVSLDDAAAVQEFRQRLWAHNLGTNPRAVEGWTPSQYIERWDAVAIANSRLQAHPEKMVGEGVIVFRPLDAADPRFRAGQRGPIHLPWGKTVVAEEVLF